MSIEKSPEVRKRQQFHSPCRTLDLKLEGMFEFVDQYVPGGEKAIFWLDFTDLRYPNFSCFESLLLRIEEQGLVKITLRAQVKDYFQRSRSNEFIKEFEALFPHSIKEPPRRQDPFYRLIHKMLQVAVETALKGFPDLVFQPISSFCYSDGTPMLTLTGIVCSKNRNAEVRAVFEGWEFANLDWGPPPRDKSSCSKHQREIKTSGSSPFHQACRVQFIKRIGVHDQQEHERHQG